MADAKLEDRRAAAALFAEGVSRAEVARRLRLSRSTATRWFRLWSTGGNQALVSAGPRGRPPKLTQEELEAVQRALVATPRESGFSLSRWSLAAVVALIQRTTGTAYHPRHVARVLRRIGWVVLPTGEGAEHAFRQVERTDPDGNTLFLRQSGRTAPGPD